MSANYRPLLRPIGQMTAQDTALLNLIFNTIVTAAGKDKEPRGWKDKLEGRIKARNKEEAGALASMVEEAMAFFVGGGVASPVQTGAFEFEWAVDFYTAGYWMQIGS